MTADPHRWKALAVLGIAYLMVMLDISIVNVALPSIQEDLDFSENGLQWVVSGYALTFGGFLLLGGRAGDILGRRIIFMVGLALFSAFSLLCGLAWSAGVLVVARMLQGAAAAILSPSVFSITTVSFEEGSERNKALGVLGAIAGSGAAIGVLLGGILTEYVGWEWVFFVNVPIGVGALFFVRRFVRESKAPGLARHFDAWGAFTVTAGLILFVFALTRAPDGGLDVARGDSLARRLGGALDGVHPHRAAVTLAACAAHHLPTTDARRLRTPSVSSSGWLSSGCSTSCRCTCRSCSGSPRSRRVLATSPSLLQPSLLRGLLRRSRRERV